MSDDASLRTLIEPPVAGFWGLDERTVGATTPCRVVRNGDVGHDGSIVREHLPVRWFRTEELTKASVDARDSILVSSGAYTGNVGRLVGQPDYPVIASNFVRRLRPLPAVCGNWLFHLCRSTSVQRHVWPHTGGSAIPNLGTSFYEGCILPALPPLPEQRAIAAVLDTLDDAIQKTEQIIAKLKQVKQGLLHDLLTRGIDDNGELRDPERHPEQFQDSPLGRIPKGWDVARFEEHIATATLGTARRGESPGGNNLRLLKMGNLAWGQVDVTSCELIAREVVGDWRTLLLNPGDLLFNTRNTPELVGKTAAWREATDDVVADNNILRARFRPRVNGVFVAAFMSSVGRNDVSRLATGTTSVAAIYWRDLRRLRYPLPLKVEQDRIVERLDAVDLRVHAECAALAQWQALKTGLAEDLLTGRVRTTSLGEVAA